ncbi:hypothetical protein BBJ29_001671 [Phytophthora kernoviae]|uniref:non-specific serine/threonine protein kinase n=1 Tax=Phytophthora kernoviae TaxID=325452 RepID=A0A3F2RRW6_9STRA|nr:hypothetical protein BBP00_00004385 [Phytophthora kernoviae]RLN71098.1 hypothetical protein BBJ29_001671 [Phytophthora kernoviae]
MDRFEELKCIGRGSYGSAHLVRERAGFYQRYVVKKIPMELLSAKEKDQSFREVELLAKLKHPNVVEYKENFVVDNVLHIVMAYCDGGDLAEKIKDQQRIREGIVGPDNNPTDPRGYFSIGQVLDWFVQMAMAIKYLHAQRVLHRDLKTSNVFLTTENVVKLGDFGIAKTLDSTLDQAKTVVGTPYYMSPEVCESKPYSVSNAKPPVIRSSTNEVEDDDCDSRFQSEAEDMNPNFQNEYSEECIDSLQIYYGSKQSEANSSLGASVPHHAGRHVRAKMGTDTKDFHWPKPTAPTSSQLVILHDSEDALELSSLSMDDNGSEAAPSLSESSIMRELELDADSDDSDASADTSQSEYEAEENFYSDNSSDAFDQSGTQYSDDFEDSDAEIIEYADDGFVSEDDEYQTRSIREVEEEGVTDLDGSLSPLICYQTSRNEDVGVVRAQKLRSPTEVQWVMRNVAQSLLLSQDDLHPLQTA